jgi:hypothetical protein
VAYRKRYSFTEEEAIISRTFDHRQEYKLAFHRLKTNLFCKAKFPEPLLSTELRAFPLHHPISPKGSEEIAEARQGRRS